MKVNASSAINASCASRGFEFRVSSFKLGVPEPLFVNLAPVRDAGYVDSFRLIVYLIHDTVITDSNAPLFVAAREFLAPGWPWNRCEAFDSSPILATSSVDRRWSSLSALAVMATR